MTIYEKNIQAFHNRHYIQSFFTLFEESRQKEQKEIQVIDTMQAVNGTSIPIISLGDTNELWRINSAYEPEKEAILWADRTTSRMNKTSLLILLGIGNGICARELLKRMGDGNMLVIYEPSIDLFTELMESYDYSDLIEDKHVTLVFDDVIPNAVFQTIYIYWRAGEGEHCVTLAHPFYPKMFPDAFAHLLHTVRENVYTERFITNTEIRFSENLIKNQFLHIPFLRKGFTLTSLKRVLPEGVPVILVCAGPSLDKNVDLLHEAKGKAIIMVVDTAIRVVMGHGIVPDFIVSMESGKPMKFFENEKCRNIPLICLPSSGDELYHYHTGMKIYCTTDDFTTEACQASGLQSLGMSPGGCVATAGFASCLFLGVSNIILIGQDLAYSKEGVTHAGGHDEGGYKRSEFYEVEGIDGSIVQSRHDWYAYLRWYVDTIEMHKNEVHVVDATEGGAKIKGTEIMPLADAINTYCIKEIDVKDCLRRIEPEANEEIGRRLDEFMVNSRIEMKSAAKTAKEAVTLCDVLLVEAKNNGATSKKTRETNQKLARCNRKILKMSIYSLIDAQVSMYERTMFEERTISSEDPEVQERINAYYDCRLLNRKIKKAVDYMLQIAEETGFGAKEETGE